MYQPVPSQSTGLYHQDRGQGGNSGPLQLPPGRKFSNETIHSLFFQVIIPEYPIDAAFVIHTVQRGRNAQHRPPLKVLIGPLLTPLHLQKIAPQIGLLPFHVLSSGASPPLGLGMTRAGLGNGK